MKELNKYEIEAVNGGFCIFVSTIVNTARFFGWGGWGYYGYNK